MQICAFPSGIWEKVINQRTFWILNAFFWGGGVSFIHWVIRSVKKNHSHTIECVDFFSQIFSSNVSQCSQASWRTNCSLLMRMTEACLMSRSSLWGGMTRQPKSPDLYSLLTVSQQKQTERWMPFFLFFHLSTVGWCVFTVRQNLGNLLLRKSSWLCCNDGCERVATVWTCETRESTVS